MVRKAFWTLSLAALQGVALWSGAAQADDSAGIIRICDRAPGQEGGGNCPNGVCQNQGGYAGSGYQGGAGYQGGGCRNGVCQTQGLGGIYAGGLGCPGYGINHTGHVYQFLDWLNPHGICTHSPDSGWSPPGKMRTPHPQAVAYQKSFPDAWTGQAGAGAGGQRAVAIYMPTDTTQLGHYYQTVPQWHAYRGMVPPTPVPSQWHRPLCQGAGCQTCRNGAQPGHVHGGEQIIQERAVDQPVDQEPHPVDEVAPRPVAPMPPAQPLEKAERPDLQPIN